MFIIDDIIGALVGKAVDLVIDQLDHNETRLRILNKFNLKPDEPPNDFEGVYVYTLIEYGVGKPEVILKLFRDEKIKSAFSDAFSKNKAFYFFQELDQFIESYALGDEIKEQNIDYQREVREFASLFIEVAKRARTHTEILQEHKLDNLQISLNKVREQFKSLSSLEAITNNLNQLVASYQNLLPSAIIKEEKRQTDLLKNLKQWFYTLGYKFESYEVLESEYFELIINIPARRGYDRIFIRGVEGEATINDVNIVVNNVEINKTDEGWIVSPRRISKIALQEIGKYRNIFTYTFDQLLDDVVDFSNYINWLETEVKSRNIDTNYVPLACTKAEIDYQTQQKLGVSHYGEEDGYIEGYIEQWLHDPAKEHISILGEFGTGKTWFAFHYAWMMLQKYKEAKEKGLERPRLPLVIPLRDYAKAVSVESLFSEFFFREHEIKLTGYSAFEQLNRMGKFILIFDGFDEMAARVNKQEMINNFWELAKVAGTEGTKVILTCRTEHFPDAIEGRRLLNTELKASTQNLTGMPPQFEVLELEKFNSEQIKKLLSFKAKPEIIEKIMDNEELLDLASRPVMINLLLDALGLIEAGKPIDIAHAYLYAVCYQMEKNIKEERTFTCLEDKLYFLCELAWEMLSTDRISLNYREFPERIRQYFQEEVKEQKDLDHWHYDMMGQTMLIRNSEGDYYPAHRSLLEFFVAFKFAVELDIIDLSFIKIKNGFQENIDLSRFKNHINLIETFGKFPLKKAVTDLILMMSDEQEETKDKLLNIIYLTRGKTQPEVGYIGGNAMTLLLSKVNYILQDLDLSNTIITNVDFTQTQMINVNLKNTNLTDSIFKKGLGIVTSVFEEISKVINFLKKINAKFENKNEDNMMKVISASNIQLSSHVPFCVKCIDSVNQDNFNEFIEQSQQIFKEKKTNKKVVILVYKNIENSQDFSLNILNASLKQHFVIIPINIREIEQGLIDSQIAKAIIDEATRKYLTEQDFFADSYPIGDTLSFFGRHKTLQILEKNLKDLQGVGIFGLRKSGKTSLILQLKLLLSDYACVHIDLQTFDSKSYYGSALFNEILAQLQKLLKKNNITYDLGNKFNESQSTSEFTTIFVNKIEELADLLETQAGVKMPIICFLDEIERILPTKFDDSNIAQIRIKEFNSFFGTLRGLNQQQRRISILVADLHPDCNRINFWHQSNCSNPVYKYFKEIFLAPFSEEDSLAMLCQIGTLMGIKFEDSLMKRIHEMGGGYPFWVRQIASLVCKKYQKVKQKEFEFIGLSVAEHFLDDIFSYSNLDEELEQNLWIPLQNRQENKIPEAVGAIPILNLLACNHELEQGVPKKILLERLSNTCNKSQLKKALKWLESVGLITCYELKDDDTYKIHVLLLLTWLLENMTQEEIKEWQL